MSNNNEKSLVVNSIEEVKENKKLGFRQMSKKQDENAGVTPPATKSEKKNPKAAQSSMAVAEEKSSINEKILEIRRKVKLQSINSGERETVEPIYAVTMKCDENVCVAEQNEDLIFYKWVGNYWKSLTKKRAEADALAWLETEYPTRATSKLASSCASTAATSMLNTRTAHQKATVSLCLVVIAGLSLTRREIFLTWSPTVKLESPTRSMQPFQQ